MTSSVSSCPTVSLLHSAFGPTSTLYTVLQCNSSSTQSELKRSYRKLALKYHPDRCTNDNDASSSTLKFQAVSAAYQILMDVKRRTAYDKTGQIIEEHEDEVPNNNSAPSYASQQQQTQWEQFFHSVFNEIITTGTNHVTSAKSYRGSSAEMKDVLYYYKMCKGDIEKVVDCIIHGTTKDIVRWKKDVIQPALDRGEIDNSFDGERSGHSCRRKAVQCSTATKQKRRRILDDSIGIG